MSEDATRLEMAHELHQAIFLGTWARPETPQQVWTMLLGLVQDLRCCVEQATCAANHGPRSAMGNWWAVEPCEACQRDVDSLLRRNSLERLESGGPRARLKQDV
jgi:hypothetical protein